MLNSLYGASVLMFFKYCCITGGTGSEHTADEKAKETFLRNLVLVAGLWPLVSG